jgi:hypothetical protein
VKLGISGLGSRVKVCEIPPGICVRHLQELELSSSWEITTTEVKEWVTKIQFQRGRLTREEMHHPPFHQIAP